MTAEISFRVKLYVPEERNDSVSLLQEEFLIDKSLKEKRRSWNIKSLPFAPKSRAIGTVCWRDKELLLCTDYGVDLKSNKMSHMK